MEILLEGLNNAQKDAVTSPASVLQVLAPPGSGKTKMLTARVAYLVHHLRYRPWNIIVCTFTIKAANEMKQRICALLGEEISKKLILGTFHSVARRFLARYGENIGVPKGFGIADSSDSMSIVKRIIKRNDYKIEEKIARARISKSKCQGTKAEQILATTKHTDEQEFARLYSEYEETLRMNDQLDYDDLLVRCVELLKQFPESVSTIESVLIDEYQDTNNVQYELMGLLAQKMKRITIVGDPDQSIYGWRAAEKENLYRMRKDYPDTIVINLENNYRSSGFILKAATAVIEQDDTRPSKSVQATHCVGEPPTMRHLASAKVEAQWIVEEICRSKTLAAGLLQYNDFAVLVRSGTQTMLIENAFGKMGIPYRVIGGHRFFDRAEVKLVLDYLRVINQPEHSDALVRIINTPSRKVGDRTVKGLLDEAEKSKRSLWRILLESSRGTKPRTEISSQAQKGIDEFVGVILACQRKLNGENYLIDLIEFVQKKIGLEAYLKKTYKENWEDRWAHVEQLVSQAAEVATSMAKGDNLVDDALPEVEGLKQQVDTTADALSNFLRNVAISIEVDKMEGAEQQQVTISTMHAAKGLEWPVVFIPGVFDGSIPHSRAEDHDEERRLLYVGMTRAQCLLYLSCPVKQTTQDETCLSKFVSPKDIQKHMSINGPTMGHPTIRGLSQILRRACPTMPDIEAARALVEQVEDDKYPLKREEIDANDRVWLETKSTQETTGPPSKRQKLKRSESSHEFSTSAMMLGPQNFSVAATTIPPNNGGFTTASTYAKVLQEAEAIKKLLNAPNAAAGRSAYKEAKKTEVKAGQGRPPKARAAGQGAITSFFTSKRSQTVPEEPEPALPTVPALPRSSSHTSSLYTSRTNPLSIIPNHQTLTRPYQPPSISQHRPRTLPMSSKPKRRDTEIDTANDKHILLSSSPAKPNISDKGQNQSVGAENIDPGPSSPSKIEKSPSSFTEFRTASTFHSTSMSRLQTSSASRGRALGMRRNVATGPVMKKFQAPRPQPRQ